MKDETSRWRRKRW